MIYHKYGLIFVAPASNKLKKYDVYDKNYKYITSFGAIRPNGIPYEQYYDKLGYYKDYNHNDKQRRDRYRKRHINDNLDDPLSAASLAWRILW